MLRSDLEKALDGIPVEVVNSGGFRLLTWGVDGVIVVALVLGADVVGCFGHRRLVGLSYREGAKQPRPVRLETVEEVEAWLDESRSATLRIERAMVEHYRTTARMPHRIDLSPAFRAKLVAELVELSRYPIGQAVAEEARSEEPPEIVMHGPGGAVSLYVAELPPGVDLRVIDARSPRLL